MVFRRLRSKKLALTFILVFAAANLLAQSNSKHGRLEVTPNGHFLQYEDGTPFFWLGDTGWDLFLKLNLQQIKLYLNNRASKGFNVIQAVVLPEPDGLRRPNYYGQVPFKHQDPTQPNNKYFTLIDHTIHLAAARKMFIGLLPTWGDKVSKMWGVGPVVFDSMNAYTYGKWLGNRYKDAPNVIWILGGDRPAFTDKMDWRPIWQAMIKGIREGTGGKALITYHPWGEHSSSEYWQGENVLDINMLQSGHARRNFNVWDMILHDYHLSPAKPVLDGESNYEGHAVDWDPKNGWFKAYDVRKQIYRSVFSGACGVTYGAAAIIQFFEPGDKKAKDFPVRYWTAALDHPGAFQAGYLKKLILSRPPLKRVPDQSIILNGQSKKNAEYITAFRDSDNSYAMIYLPVGKKIEVNTSWMKTDKIRVWWFNPRTGKAQKAGVFKKKNKQWFTSPSLGIKNDWVLVLEDAAKKWPAPGISKINL